MIVANEKVISIHYTLKNDEGVTLDTSDGQAPLAFIQGKGNIIPGLEKALDGKKVGDKVNAVIPPDEAYGAKNAELVKKLSKLKLVFNFKFNFHKVRKSLPLSVLKKKKSPST